MCIKNFGWIDLEQNLVQHENNAIIHFYMKPFSSIDPQEAKYCLVLYFSVAVNNTNLDDIIELHVLLFN